MRDYWNKLEGYSGTGLDKMNTGNVAETVSLGLSNGLYAEDKGEWTSQGVVRIFNS